MPKSPPVFTRPHSIHQSLQLQALDARADRQQPSVQGLGGLGHSGCAFAAARLRPFPCVRLSTWPSTMRKLRSPVPLSLHADSPYLLAKPLKPARRLPPPPTTQLAAVSGVSHASSFFYNAINFFEYSNPLTTGNASKAAQSASTSTPTTSTTTSTTSQKEPPLKERTRGRSVSKSDRNVAAAAAAKAKIQTEAESSTIPPPQPLEPRRNTFKRLRRDSASSTKSQTKADGDTQRNTVAFPSSSATEEHSKGEPRDVDIRVRKRARQEKDENVAPAPSSCSKQGRSAESGQWTPNFHDLFYKTLSAPIPRKKKRSRRQRLFGRQVRVLFTSDSSCGHSLCLFSSQPVPSFRGWSQSMKLVKISR
jgi:hypothetical protein